MKEITGQNETLEDVDRILKSGRMPILGNKARLNIKEHLDENSGDTPAVVHVFDLQDKFIKEIAQRLENRKNPLNLRDIETKLNFNHTLLVLGKGEDGVYLSFQKRGPDIDEPFEVLELDKATELAVIPGETERFVSIIGPAMMEQSRKG